jgi:hypothetical protein
MSFSEEYINKKLVNLANYLTYRSIDQSLILKVKVILRIFYRHDRDYTRRVIKSFARTELFDNYVIMMELCKISSFFSKFLTNNLRDNFEFIRESITYFPYTLLNASIRLKNDPSLIIYLCDRALNKTDWVSSVDTLKLLIKKITIEDNYIYERIELAIAYSYHSKRSKII